MEAEYLAALGDLSLDALLSEGDDGGDTADELAPETRVTGRVAKIHRDDVFVDLRGRNQGVVPLRQFDDAAGRRRRAGTARRASSMPTKASTSSRGRPRRSTSAIGTT